MYKRQLGRYQEGDRANVERAARDGAEIGGHPLSGHVDFTSEVVMVKSSDTNRLMRFSIPEAFRKYVFAKGYIAINGASLTVSEVNRAEGWFEVWLIPETRRMTVFEDKQVGDHVNIEIERSTQVVVDTDVYKRQGTPWRRLPAVPRWKRFLARACPFCRPAWAAWRSRNWRPPCARRARSA